MAAQPRPTRAVTIRPAETGDAEGLARVYLDAARHHAAIDPEVHREPDPADALERIRGKLANPHLAVFAAEAGGEVVGLLEVEALEPPPAGAMLRPVAGARLGIAVREDRRDLGIGTALMAAAEQWARDNGCTTLVLDMSASNEAALRFYERLGYRTYGLLLRKPLAATDGEARGSPAT